MGRPDGAAPVGSTRASPTALWWAVGILLAARLGGAVWLDRHPAAEGAAESAGAVAWVTPAAADALAPTKDKPILYDFTAAWCPPCKRMNAEVFANAADAAFINAHCVPVRVMDRSSEDGRNLPVVAALQKQYEITAFPTLVVVYADGRSTATLQGYGSAETTRTALRALLARRPVTEKPLKN